MVCLTVASQKVRDLASSLWMGVPVFLALMSHVLPLGLWSARYGVGGLVLLFLVYAEFIMFLLPWILTEGQRGCCGIENCRMRFLIVAQILISLVSVVFALMWRFHIPKFPWPTSTSTPASTSTLDAPWTLSTPMTLIPDQDPHTGSGTTSDPASVNVSREFPNTTSGDTTHSILPGPFFVTEEVKDGVLFFMMGLEGVTLVFFLAVFVRPTLWLNMCKKLGVALCRKQSRRRVPWSGSLC
jgi:hypothetical protein